MAQPVPSTEGCVGTAISRDSMLAKVLFQGVFAEFQGKLIPSVQNPGKIEAIIHGAPIGEFDTENEAMTFLRGFTFGLSVGAGIKNMADGLAPFHCKVAHGRSLHREANPHDFTVYPEL